MTKPIPFGKYYLLDRINVGGMAEVFKAKAFGVEGFERLVAVKRILPNIAEDEEFITMFIDEAKIAVQLQHANVAQIFDLGKVDDSFFIALEYVHGKDLRAIFDDCRKTGERMPMAQACFIIMQVCEGLDYAHNKRDAQGRELNLVHRDVSPQNVLIGFEGEIKIVDFGIAKAAGKASKTQAGILKGKFGYMSPEQVRGLPVDRRSDIFALGIVIYELLTGERLFIGESDFSTLEKVRNVEILPPSSFNRKVPAELERIVLKALAKDVEDRYQNAIDLHDDLQAFLYAVGEFYSRKDLAGWMKKTFAAELAEQNAKLEEYEQLEEPTPAPMSPLSSSSGIAAPGMTPASEGARAKKGPGLDWDDEELETQIFDKPPGTESAENELTSSDLFLNEGDDKTVAGAPPELLGDDTNQSGDYAPPSGQPYALSRTLGGPPQGLGAYRQGAAPDGQPTGGGLHAEGLQAGGAYNPSRAFRQTYTGPAEEGGVGGLPITPGRRPAGPLTTKKPHTALYAGAAALGLIICLVLYRQQTKPGKITIAISPGDAEIQIDDTPVKGSSPFTVERSPGMYRLVVKRDGYVRKDQSLEIQAGELSRVEVQLDASPDTGFELTSEPPGALVWLDGQPFTGRDPQGSQARTNFKAYPVTPGRHVLEIKGDPRYNDWRLEFLQDPGKTMKLHANLVARMEAKTSGRPPSVPPTAPATTTRPTTPVAGTHVPAPVAKAPVAGTRAPAPVAKTATHAPEPARKERPVASASPPQRARSTTGRSPTPSGRNRAPVRRTVAIKEKETKATDGGGDEDRPTGRGECSITVGSKPWSEVWVDGKSTSKITPLVGYQVPCGRHKLTFKNPELKIELTKSISVRAGEKFKQVFTLIDTEE